MKKKNKNSEVELMKKYVKEEALDAFIDYDVDFHFDHYSKDVQTLYVRESMESKNPVEFYMLESLENKIQKINSRYRVGILYTEKTKEAENLNEFR